MFIIHGDNQLASRALFLEKKRQQLASGFQVIELNGQGLTLAELQTKSLSTSLFGNENSIFIEELFSGRVSREKKLITEFLQAGNTADFNIWEPKDVSAQLKQFSPDEVRKFDLPKYVFQFLDRPGLDLLQKAMANTAPEQIFSLLVGHYRKLIQVKNHAGNFPDWQQQKLSAQAAGMSPEKLLTLYKSLLDIDYRQKTSAGVFDLTFSLELWVLGL
jgi:hypothetical protein